MSMNFNEAMNPEVIAMLKEKMGDQIVDMDEHTVLFDNLKVISQPDMRQIANTARQPVSIELNDEGEIKTMSDGTKYKCTVNGWRKVTAEDEGQVRGTNN